MKLSGLLAIGDHRKRRSETGDPLETLQKIIDIEAFRPMLEARLGYSDASKGGRLPYNPVMTFRMLILARWGSPARNCQDDNRGSDAWADIPIASRPVRNGCVGQADARACPPGQRDQISGAIDGRACLRPAERPHGPVHPPNRHQTSDGQDRLGQHRLRHGPPRLPRATHDDRTAAPEIQGNAPDQHPKTTKFASSGAKAAGIRAAPARFTRLSPRPLSRLRGWRPLPAVPTTRASNAELPANEVASGIRFDRRLFR